LPATMAIALRFLTDRLIPQAISGSTGPSAPADDFTVRGSDAYLAWAARLLPDGWNEHPSWAQFNVLMFTLIAVYAVWGVTSYYRGYFSQLAGHRVILDLRTDLYQH